MYVYFICDLKIVVTLSARVYVCKFQAGQLIGTEVNLPHS
jgi:hypothetical protein